MPDQPKPEVHIASFIVHFHPADAEAIALALRGMEGIEPLPPEEPRVPGKQVVICEAPDQGRILDHMDSIGQLPGVVGCSLVYHEVMSALEADQQMITEVKSV